MAMQNCSECNKEVSDKAPACIHCGCPTNSSRGSLSLTNKTQKTNLDSSSLEAEGGLKENQVSCSRCGSNDYGTEHAKTEEKQKDYIVSLAVTCLACGHSWHPDQKSDRAMAAKLVNIMKADGRVIEGGYTPDEEDYNFAYSHYERNSMVQANGSDTRSSFTVIREALLAAGIKNYRSAEHEATVERITGVIFLVILGAIVIGIIIASN